MSGRPRSLLLDLTNLNETANNEDDGPVYRAEIVLALEEAGIKKDEIYGLEAPWKNKYYVVFKSSQLRHSQIDKAIKIRESYYNLKLPYPPQQARPQKTRVRIYGYPLDEESKNLETVLRQYGRAKAESTKDLTDWTVDLRSGIKEIYMDIDKAIPSYITVGRYKVKVSYWGQQQTCKKCHEPGHHGNECTKFITCRECGGNDHLKKNCPKACCFGCGETGHLSHQCPKDFPTIEEGLETDKQTEGPETNEMFGSTFNMPTGDWPDLENENTNEEEKNGKEEPETQVQPETESKDETEKMEQDETPKDADETGKEITEITDKEKETPKGPKETEEKSTDKEKEEQETTKKAGEQQTKEIQPEKEKKLEDPKETTDIQPDKRDEKQTRNPNEAEEEKTEDTETKKECDHESITTFSDENKNEINNNPEPQQEKEDEKEDETETETESSDGTSYTDARAGKRKSFKQKVKVQQTSNRKSRKPRGKFKNKNK